MLSNNTTQMELQFENISEDQLFVVLILLTIIISLSIIFGTLSNLSVIFLTVNKYRLHRISYYLLLHLATCDLITLCPMGLVLLLEMWNVFAFTAITYAIVISIRSVIIMVSLINVLLIAFDRFSVMFTVELSHERMSCSIFILLFFLGWFMGIVRCLAYFSIHKNAVSLNEYVLNGTNPTNQWVLASSQFIPNCIALYQQLSVQFILCAAMCALCYACIVVKSLIQHRKIRRIHNAVLTTTSDQTCNINNSFPQECYEDSLSSGKDMDLEMKNQAPIAMDPSPSTYLSFGNGSDFVPEPQKLRRMQRIQRYLNRKKPKIVRFMGDELDVRTDSSSQSLPPSPLHQARGRLRTTSSMSNIPTDLPPLPMPAATMGSGVALHRRKRKNNPENMSTFLILLLVMGNLPLTILAWASESNLIILWFGSNPWANTSFQLLYLSTWTALLMVAAINPVVYSLRCPTLKQELFRTVKSIFKPTKL